MILITIWILFGPVICWFMVEQTSRLGLAEAVTCIIGAPFFPLAVTIVLLMQKYQDVTIWEEKPSNKRNKNL